MASQIIQEIQEIAYKEFKEIDQNIGNGNLRMVQRKIGDIIIDKYGEDCPEVKAVLDWWGMKGKSKPLPSKVKTRKVLPIEEVMRQFDAMIKDSMSYLRPRRD